MTYLSKDDIFKAEDLPTRDVEVPEWGGVVRVRALSGSDRDAYDASMLRAQSDGSVLRVPGSRAKLVSLCIVKDDGDPMFNEFDIGRLAQKSATALDRVVNAVVELSALSDEAVGELEGNSDAAPSGDSGSTSPGNSE
jgi:hypothetical protein